MTCLKAAIAAGADAVYLGGQKFGARAFAGNFSDEELLEALKLAHFFHKKIYLTVNTLTKDAELETLIPWLAPFYEAGLDGLIIQDIGVLERCRSAFPGMLLHASTQMTVTEAWTALFLKERGVSRIVPARELSLAELVLLKQETGMELETFIHGALCYSYSGQCLFSSLLGGRSGNRGRCAQPCRLPYQIAAQGGQKRRGGKAAEQYPLSLKDLCVLPFLPKLIDAGIDSFKIEGRMKSPEYVAGVTGLYRKYIDLYEQDPAGWHVEAQDMELLSGLYVRSGQSGGYYEKHNGREMVTLQKPGYGGASEEILFQIRATYLKQELTRTADLKICLKEGAAAALTASCGGVSVCQQGMTVLPAQKKPLAREDVTKQLRRTGGSHFSPGRIEVLLDGNVFLPISALNDLRRQTLELLFETIAAPAARLPQGTVLSGAGKQSGRAAETAASGHSAVWGRPRWYVTALNAGQALAAVAEPEISGIYLSADAVFDSPDLEKLLLAVRARKASEEAFSFFLTLPVILRAYSGSYFERLMTWLSSADHEALTDGLQAGGISGILWARQYGWRKGVLLNHSAYVFNAETWNVFLRQFHAERYTAPLELNRSELKRLPAQEMEIMVYGRIPMMQSAGCIRRTAGECRIPHTMETLSKATVQRSCRYFLKDRYQAEFPVLVNCGHCMNTIYNSVPLSLHQYLTELSALRPAALRLDFTLESPEETGQIIRFFTRGTGMPPASYTTGHYKKGVQ